MSKMLWNTLWVGGLGVDHELVPALVMAGKCASHEGIVAIPADEADTWLDALAQTVAAGWLAPIEEMADGSLRTRLTLPEGVAP